MKISSKLTLMGIAGAVGLTALGAVTWWTKDVTGSALNATNSRSRHIDLCRDMSEMCSQLELAATDSINDRAQGRPSGDRLAMIEESVTQLESDVHTLIDGAGTEDERQSAELITETLPLAIEAVDIRLMNLLETRGNLHEATRQEFAEIGNHLDELGAAVEDSLDAIEASVRSRLKDSPEPRQLTVAVDLTGKLRTTHLEATLATTMAIFDREEDAIRWFSESRPGHARTERQCRANENVHQGTLS